MNQWLQKYDQSEWSGSGELWLDPEGNDTYRFDCRMRIEDKKLHYSWSYQNETIKGSFTFHQGGGSWIDSWHQPEPADCIDVPNAWGLFTFQHSYQVPSNPDWGWQIKLSERPTGQLVLQMTNIAPWGEEGRAVRMIFEPGNAKT